MNWEPDKKNPCCIVPRPNEPIDRLVKRVIRSMKDHRPPDRYHSRAERLRAKNSKADVRRQRAQEHG